MTPKQQFLKDLKNDLDYQLFKDRSKIRTYQRGDIKVIGSYGNIIAKERTIFNTNDKDISQPVRC